MSLVTLFFIFPYCFFFDPGPGPSLPYHMMTRRYKHTPLVNPRLIRLLRLKGGSRERSGDSILECELVQASLNDAPEYSALSYAWESQAPTELVLCEGTELYVTANCAAALRNLASDVLAQNHTIWVDSICIDQSSDEERSHQVTLMAEIYTKAQEVVVWLGEGDKKSADMMDELKHLALLAKTSPGLADSRYRTAVEAVVSGYFANWPVELVNPVVFWSVETFEDTLPLFPVFGLSWFDRLWTLQEIVLAKKAVVRYGGISIPWEDVRLVSDTLTTGNASSGFTQYPGDSFQRVRTVCALRNLLRIDKGPDTQEHYRLPDDHPFGPLEACVPETEGIASHFIVSCHLGATDPRDKVYGQYGILQQYGIKLPLPDYNKPLSAIYKETARAIIEHDASLELLYYSSLQGGAADLTGLPSWAPDCSFDAFAWIPGYEFTAAAGQSTARFRFDGSGKLLIYGARIGRVAAKTHAVDGLKKYPMPADWSSRRSILLWHHRIMRQFHLWARFALSDRNTGGSGVEALCCLLLQEIALSAQASPESWSRLVGHFTAWVQALLADHIPSRPASQTIAIQASPSVLDSAGSATGQTCPNGVDNGDNGFEDSSAGSEREVEWMEGVHGHLEQNTASRIIQDMAVSRADGNCLFLTDGGLLGIATEQLLEGDEVYLVAGLRLPMVFRRAQAVGYRCIGAAYVHGVMKGEMWDINQDALEEFEVV